MTAAFLPTPSFPLERMTHKILAHLYRNRTGMLLRCGYALLEQAGSRQLTETDEKFLRQVQLALRKLYLRPAEGKDTTRVPQSLRDICGRLRALLRDRARKAPAWHLDYAPWKESLGLEDWQMRVLYETCVTFQLTSGCANFCRRCNEWALPRVRGHFSETAARTILMDLLSSENQNLALYGGSDPLDWEDGATTLADLLTTLPGPHDFSLLTKIPKGKEGRMKALVDLGIDIAVSLTDRNRARVEALEHRMDTRFTKQHATTDLLIPACMDEDFSTVKPSITDSYGSEISPDGACIIIPTFTSALYPFGHKKIPVTGDTPWFPVKLIGRPALLQDYFKPLEVIGRDGRPFYLDRLLDVQVENMLLDNGEDALTPPGMRSVKEYFEVFDEAARLKRRAMTLSVMKRLKRTYLADTSYRALSPSRKAAYRKKISAHLDFTRRENVLCARRCAAAFFLAAAGDYIRFNPVKQEIIAHLTREEYGRIEKIAGRPALLLGDYSDPETFAWQLFRHQVLYLVHGGSPGPVEDFTASCRAAYDPDRDLFICSS